MGDPLRFSARPSERAARRALLRRQVVDIPVDVPPMHAVFFLLRRIRIPLVTVVTIFGVAVLGLTLIPGVDSEGREYRMTPFDAFYFISYTATSIGFGEVPHAFTVAQRLWVTGCIYASVVGWAFTVARLVSVFQDQGFRDAVSVERFRSRVGRITEPFHILAGFGHAGRLVAHGLDERGRMFVVTDGQRSRIELLVTDQLTSDPPGLYGELTDPSTLGLAGLGHQHCAGVLAVTDDDEVNLATVAAVRLLRPDIPVLARCSDRVMEERMHDFAPQAIINPYDRFGGYLLVSITRPHCARLSRWLMSPKGSPIPDLREGLAHGRWVVCADGHFGREVLSDLTTAGMDVVMVDPADGDPDIARAVGFIAGTESDTLNLSLAAHARLEDPDVFLVVRQKNHANAVLARALDADELFMPTELVSREMLARIVTPMLWSFVEHTLAQPDEWAQQVTDRLLDRCGRRQPETLGLTIDAQHAPALHRWLQDGQTCTVADLTRHPDDRDDTLGAVVLAIHRDGEQLVAPDDDEALRPDDRLLIAGTSIAHQEMTEMLHYDSATEYVATGRQVPQTWAWRMLTGRRSVRSGGRLTA